jgi:ABC-type polysaccharide/polyol phosphate transport system ATPase subunit
VIGRNGSGKTTLLRLLAGVSAPTVGRLRVVGSIAPLIGVGVGFNPELTGRENVFANGQILGLPKSQLVRDFDDIVGFAELERFVDTPVKFYSSGMFVRLGFAVAIHTEPDVLLVDEVLAVGDFAFQLKCFDRMMERRKSGATIVVVSHNLAAVRRLCDRTVVLDGGEPRFDGDTVQAISLYHQIAGEQRDLEAEEAGPGAGGASIESFNLRGPDGQVSGNVRSGEAVTFRLELRFDRDVQDPVIGFRILDEKGLVVYSESSFRHGRGSRRAGERIAYEVGAELRLTTGSYTAETSIVSADLKTVLDRVDPLPFYVSGRQMVRGVADLGASFQVVPLGATDDERPLPAVTPGDPDPDPVAPTQPTP